MSKLTNFDLTKKPSDKTIWLYDNSQNKGHGELAVRITPNGIRRFYFRYFDPNKKRVWLSLGTFDKDEKTGLTLSKARFKVAEYSLIHQNETKDVKGYLGKKKADLDEEIEESKKEALRKASRATVLDIFELWEKTKLCNRKDHHEVRRIFAKDIFPEIGHLFADEIDPEKIIEVIDRINERGAKILAKGAFTCLRTMFRFALMRKKIKLDPTATIDKKNLCGSANYRTRTLSETEIKLLFERLPYSGLSVTSKLAVLIVISTGCRIGELLRARWEHIDFENKTWFIPKENSKNKIPLNVHLSDFTHRQFKELNNIKNSHWLFPARHKSKGDTFVCLKTVTKQIGDRQRENIGNNKCKNINSLSLSNSKWTMHDLRRTAATTMSKLGTLPSVIDRCLNHIEENKLRKIYFQHDYANEKIEAWNNLGNWLDSLVPPKPGAP